MESIYNYNKTDIKCPIILLDVSGTTKNDYDESITIFDKLVLSIKDISKNDNFKSCHLIIWAKYGHYIGNQ